MLIRIKNANLVKSREVSVIKNNLVLDIVKLLKKEGFIESFEECDKIDIMRKNFVFKFININLKYKGIKQKPYITNIKRVSKPGFRVYVNNKNIPKVLDGVGIAVCA